MAEPFRIESREDGASLELRPLDRDYFLAELRSRGLQAIVRVGTYLSTGLGEFFTAMAADWKGWTGTRAWSSLEGELQLEATMDRTGHVYLSVHLRHLAPADWQVDAQLVLEAGQLDRWAAEAREFEASAVRAA